MSQPTFVPIAAPGEVRPAQRSGIPDRAGRPKPGLLRGPGIARGTGAGTPAPGEGYAFTLAHRECGSWEFENVHDREDVQCALALVSAARASLVGRAPAREDLDVARDILGYLSDRVTHGDAQPVAGLAHSYAAQRRFVDAIDRVRLLAGRRSLDPDTTER